MERMSLLICDLDGTLLGDDESLALFAEWYATACKSYRLVYSSGRFVDSIMDSIESSLLPEPDAIIGGVGTQIYEVAKARYLPMWPPVVIEWNPYIVQSIADNFTELQLQPSEFISRHKVSYYGRELDDSFLKNLEKQMVAAGQSVSMVYSSQRDLDLLPLKSNKGAAAIHLAQQWKIRPEQVLVAGDSGNDADMFCAGFRGIVVGNAEVALKSLKSPTVYVAENHCAAGVLEGLLYWQSDRVNTSTEQVGAQN